MLKMAYLRGLRINPSVFLLLAVKRSKEKKKTTNEVKIMSHLAHSRDPLSANLRGVGHFARARSATAPSINIRAPSRLHPCPAARPEDSAPVPKDKRKAANTHTHTHARTHASTQQTEEGDRPQWGGLRAARRWASRRGRGRRRRTRSSSPTSSASATATGARCPSKPVSHPPDPPSRAS
jgi:hypothetical protein